MAHTEFCVLQEAWQGMCTDPHCMLSPPPRSPPGQRPWRAGQRAIRVKGGPTWRSIFNRSPYNNTNTTEIVAGCTSKAVIRS